MINNLLNPWALDSNGKIIGIEHAQKGQDYTCPKCGEPLSYCKSGTGPHTRRDHFKHKADTNCVGYSTPHETESYIHKTAKEGICRILLSCLENQRPFPISWTCPSCGQQFEGDLLNGASEVKTENVVASARSDVAILNEQGDEIVAIEVVYKHDVEQSTLELYEEKKITLVRLIFRSVEDLNDLEQKLHNPDSVNICLNVKCNDCQTSHLQRHIIPLQNHKGEYDAIAVAILNPFDSKQLTWGLPFNEQDKQNAVDYVRRNCPNVPINLEPAKQSSGQYYARIVVQRQNQIQIQMPMPMPRIMNPYGTGLDALMAQKQKQNYMIRKTYAQRARNSSKRRGR